MRKRVIFFTILLTVSCNSDRNRRAPENVVTLGRQERRLVIFGPRANGGRIVVRSEESMLARPYYRADAVTSTALPARPCRFRRDPASPRARSMYR